jgi:hypothetical protein
MSEAIWLLMEFELTQNEFDSTETEKSIRRENKSKQALSAQI